MQKIIAANFKTNHTRASAEVYLQKLNTFLQQCKNNNHIWIFPPLTALRNNDFTTFQIGAQNAYPITHGAMTGEVGLEMLEEFSIRSLLIGHSERREILNESEALIRKKCDFFAQHHFVIFYCIGESLAVRERGSEEVFAFLSSQLSSVPTDYPHLIVAYEPIWAIGTGVSATLSDITTTHQFLKEKLPSIPLLYGGSVNPENVATILAIPYVDGVLVGSASWQAEAFCKLLQNTTMQN